MNKTGVVMVTASTLAVVVVFALILRPDPMVHLEALEHRIEELEHRVAALDAPSADGGHSAHVAVLGSGLVEKKVARGPDPSASERVAPEVMARLQHVERAVTESDRTLSETIDERVAEVVDKKISKLEKKQNLKPPLSDFVEVLDLDEIQQGTVEDLIWLGQDEVRAVLETPTADGTVFVDGLVEALAYYEAEHPEAGQVFMAWLGQVMSTTIPGSDETYAGRIEAAKNDVRAALRRELTEEQYAEFEGWKVDPTEVQDIEDSPWNDLGDRIERRAQELRQ